MKESYWGYWIILLGIFIVVVMLLTQNATTSNTQDYYQLKEVANSAIYDSIDYAYYAKTTQIRIMKEVFVENFIRRFAETVGTTDSYQIDFYDLYESPPKVSVKVSSKTANFIVANDNTSLDVVNSIDLIVEFGDKGTENGDTPDGCDYYKS
mgnify:CR=1 FL=1